MKIIFLALSVLCVAFAADVCSAPGGDGGGPPGGGPPGHEKVFDGHDPTPAEEEAEDPGFWTEMGWSNFIDWEAEWPGENWYENWPMEAREKRYEAYRSDMAKRKPSTDPLRMHDWEWDVRFFFFVLFLRVLRGILFINIALHRNA